MVAKVRKQRPSSSSSRDAESDDDELAYEPEEVSQRRDPYYRFQVDKEIQQMRLQLSLEHIMEKYSRPFENGDEIDLLRNEIVVDRGHIKSMRNEKDVEGVRGPSMGEVKAPEQRSGAKGRGGSGQSGALLPKRGSSTHHSTDEDEDRILGGANNTTTSALVPTGSSMAVQQRPHAAFGSGIGGPEKLTSLALSAAPFGKSPLAFDAPMPAPVPNPWGPNTASNPMWQAPELPIPPLKSTFAAGLFVEKYNIPTRDYKHSIWAPGGDKYDDEDDDVEEIARLRPRPRLPPVSMRWAPPKTRTMKLLQAPQNYVPDEEDEILMGPKTLPDLPALPALPALPPARSVGLIGNGEATCGDKATSKEDVQSGVQRPSGRRKSTKPTQTKTGVTGSTSKKVSAAEKPTDLTDLLATPQSTRTTTRFSEKTPGNVRGISQTLFVDLSSSHLLNDDTYISVDDAPGLPSPPPSDCEPSSVHLGNQVLKVSRERETPRPPEPDSAAHDGGDGQDGRVLPPPSKVSDVANGQVSEKAQAKQVTKPADQNIHRNEVDPSYEFSDEERGFTRITKKGKLDDMRKTQKQSRVMTALGEMAWLEAEPPHMGQQPPRKKRRVGDADSHSPAHTVTEEEEVFSEAVMARRSRPSLVPKIFNCDSLFRGSTETMAKPKAKRGRPSTRKAEVPATGSRRKETATQLPPSPRDVRTDEAGQAEQGSDDDDASELDEVSLIISPVSANEETRTSSRGEKNESQDMEGTSADAEPDTEMMDLLPIGGANANDIGEAVESAMPEIIVAASSPDPESPSERARRGRNTKKSSKLVGPRTGIRKLQKPTKKVVAKPGPGKATAHPSPNTPTRKGGHATAAAAATTPSSKSRPLSWLINKSPSWDLGDELSLSVSPLEKRRKARESAIKPGYFARKPKPASGLALSSSLGGRSRSRSRPISSGSDKSAQKRTPKKLSHPNTLFRTPGGTTRECGENGMTCGGDFCFTCLGEST